MRGRRSKNSPVEGFVTVQSGSGSFFGSAYGSIALETLCRQRRKRNRIDMAISWPWLVILMLTALVALSSLDRPVAADKIGI
jgi:hypothetical protein